MNEGPLSSPFCASAGRSVPARGGRPLAWMLAESRSDGLLAKSKGRGWGSGVERCSSLYRFVNFEDQV
jgi:hypothetical protein